MGRRCEEAFFFPKEDRYHLTPVIMAITKKFTNNECWCACGITGTLPHCWFECKLVQALCRHYGKSYGGS